jgi:hypothetical protein
VARRRRSWWVSILASYFLWLAVRTVFSVALGSSNSDYRFAFEAGFGEALWRTEALLAFLMTGAAVAVWSRWRHAVAAALVALTVLLSLTVFQLRQVERLPGVAREAYATSRRTRGLPVTDERLDIMFSPAGRKLTWLVAAMMIGLPMGLLVWRRHEFVIDDADLRSEIDDELDEET